MQKVRITIHSGMDSYTGYYTKSSLPKHRQDSFADIHDTAYRNLMICDDRLYITTSKNCGVRYEDNKVLDIPAGVDKDRTLSYQSVGIGDSVIINCGEPIKIYFDDDLKKVRMIIRNLANGK